MVAIQMGMFSQLGKWYRLDMWYRLGMVYKRVNISRQVNLARRTIMCAVALLLAATCRAEPELRTEHITFKAGANSTQIDGRIKGYATVDYILPGQAGQPINVSLASRHKATYFNLLAPGETQVAFFNGSLGDNQYEGTLPTSGDYTVRIYMMRSAARRNESAQYRLEVILGQGLTPSEQAAKPIEPDSKPRVHTTDAKVPGTPYHATGSIPCALAPAKALSQCPFGVKRTSLGSGLVDITLPSGLVRTIRFEQGTATGFIKTPNENAVFSAEKKGDNYSITNGDEHFEIPEAVIMGG